MAISGNLAHTDSQQRSDLVAYWSVPLIDGVHTVEFEHGTTSGKRVLRVDGKEIVRREWMFKLVGEERFYLGKQKTSCELRVDPLSHFMFGYSLVVDGKPYEKFAEKQNKMLKSWAVISNNKRFRIVLDKHSMEVFVNGQLIDVESSFITGGTEMKFSLDGQIEAALKATSATKADGVIYKLYFGDHEMEEDEQYKL